MIKLYRQRLSRLNAMKRLILVSFVSFFASACEFSSSDMPDTKANGVHCPIPQAEICFTDDSYRLSLVDRGPDFTLYKITRNDLILNVYAGNYASFKNTRNPKIANLGGHAVAIYQSKNEDGVEFLLRNRGVIFPKELHVWGQGHDIESYYDIIEAMRYNPLNTRASLDDKDSRHPGLDRYETDIALADFTDRWRAAYEAGDFEAMRDLYEPDAWLMTRHQPARKSRDEILTYFKTSRQSGAKVSIKFEYEDETTDGEYAFKIAKWWLESQQATGEPIRDSGRSLVIFKRGPDGMWRLWRDIDNHTPDVKFRETTK